MIVTAKHPKALLRERRKARLAPQQRAYAAVLRELQRYDAQLSPDPSRLPGDHPMATTTDTLSRTTINLSGVQLAWLKRESKKLGITLGELLRRIVDEKRGAK